MDILQTVGELEYPKLSRIMTAMDIYNNDTTTIKRTIVFDSNLNK